MDASNVVVEYWLTTVPQMPDIPKAHTERDSLPVEGLAWLVLATAYHWSAEKGDNLTSDAWRRAARRAVPATWDVCPSDEPDVVIVRDPQSRRYACGWWDETALVWKWGRLIWNNPDDWNTWMIAASMPYGSLTHAHPLIRWWYEQGVDMARSSFPTDCASHGNVFSMPMQRLHVLNRLFALRLAAGEDAEIALVNVIVDAGMCSTKAPYDPELWWVLDPEQRQAAWAWVSPQQCVIVEPDPTDYSWRPWATDGGFPSESRQYEIARCSDAAIAWDSATPFMHTLIAMQDGLHRIFTMIVTIAAIASADSRSLPIAALMHQRQLALHLLITVHAWRSAPDEVRMACLQALAARGWPDVRCMHMVAPGTSSPKDALTVIQDSLLATLPWSADQIQFLWHSISQLILQITELPAVHLLVCRSAPRWDDCQRILNLPAPS